MSTNRHIDKICLAALSLALVLALGLSFVFASGGAMAQGVAMGYEDRLFDTERVHTIDIVMDGWDEFLETCENEEYTAGAVIIDGEAYRNVGIRAKGNTSLTTVSSMDSDRYSFKIDFGHYDSGNSYYGLDKLSLNNLIQDATMMKDYLAYRLMGSFAVNAPLCSYVYITVNGEDWGLYLAVEGIDQSFLQRNYGSNYGELYKPDSSSLGGGRGNGRGFDGADFDPNSLNGEGFDPSNLPENVQGFGEFSQNGGEPPKGFDPSSLSDGETPEGFDPSSLSDGEMPEGFDPPNLPDGEMPEGFNPSSLPQGGIAPGGGMGSMGSADVKLQYIDDDPDSYPNLFDNAKTDVTQADKTRLIAALQTLSESEHPESAVQVDEVLRYFVVHNFLCNDDSYTGTMIHNYYLYEDNGVLSMLPWDYNLSFGGFRSGSASETVNAPIDLSLGDRPMADWIFNREDNTALYHQYYARFLADTDFDALIRQAAELIAPYVQQDPTKFYTYEEFETGVATLKTFCQLRVASIEGQLDGTIPSTAAGQSADSSTLIDASHITISDMGSMNMGGTNMSAGGFGGGFGNRGEGSGGERPDNPGEPPANWSGGPAPGGNDGPGGGMQDRPE